MINWSEKLGKLLFLKEDSKMNPWNKNHSIWISICREIKKENSIVKKEKLTKIHKIKLIYASKLKYYVIGRKIRKKTHNLTQKHTKKIQLITWWRLFI